MKYYQDKKKKLSFGIMCTEESCTITQRMCINKVNRLIDKALLKKKMEFVHTLAKVKMTANHAGFQKH